MDTKLPRLNRNAGFLGPEYAGCSGTGQRPKILRCGYSGRYIVGTEFDVYELRALAITSPNKRVIRRKKQTIWAFKTRGPAVAKFKELCETVLKFNARVREDKRRDLAAARTGDLAAALRLGDY